MAGYVGNQPNFATTPVQTATGDGTANPITLNYVPGSSSAILVTFNGIVQTPELHYTVFQNQLTPTGPIPTGYPILIVYKQIASQLGTTSASAVSFDPSNSNITSVNVQNALKELDLRSGAKGGGTDRVFFENDAVIGSSYTIGSTSFQTVSISIASPAVISLANHGFFIGQKLVFQTTGSLPSGLTANQVYYVIAEGLTTSNFQVSATLNGTAVTTIGTQSGAQTVCKVKNAVSAGPITILDNANVTINEGSFWSITG